MKRDCRICGGALALAYPGSADALTPEAMSPSRHRPGEHGDLYVCGDCGSVHQLPLPDRRRLHALYRAMTDDRYLGEEIGRRRTANRLLDLIAGRVSEGRLLDVGCGYGLLLAEARRRGYQPLGLELSTSAARHARVALGLEVLEVPLEDFSAGPGEQFDVIVLADVLEHLHDPIAALDRCVELLAPGGLLCIVTPDPSSPAARFAGPRWWGYLPAHCCLLPRRVVRELLAVRNLLVSVDVPLVRSFTLGRWIEGLAERVGPAGALLQRLSRTRLARRHIALSLGDERVVLAHRLVAQRLAEPAGASPHDNGIPRFLRRSTSTAAQPRRLRLRP